MQPSFTFYTFESEQLKEILNDILPEALERALEKKHFLYRQEKEAEKFLTRQEAALFLKQSLSSINNRIRDGKIPVKRLGRRILISEAELLKSLQQPNRKRR